MSHSLFCYGTLMAPEVMRRVINREVTPGIPAVLSGYACYQIRDAWFPGLRAQQDAQTEGILYTGLSNTALAALDQYEGYLYSRSKLTVTTRESENELAWCYLLKTQHLDQLTQIEWDFNRFRQALKRSGYSR